MTSSWGALAMEALLQKLNHEHGRACTKEATAPVAFCGTKATMGKLASSNKINSKSRQHSSITPQSTNRSVIDASSETSMASQSARSTRRPSCSATLVKLATQSEKTDS